MNNIFYREYKSPAGVLLIGSMDERLCLCDWKYRKMRETVDRRISRILDASFEEGDTPVIRETERQLNEYFMGDRKEFTIPLLPAGTEFQKRVWRELQNIAYGETISYIELAERLDASEAVRAAASANGANSISIIIPCHRVIGKQGNLGGYAGGLGAKKKLLDLEQTLPEQRELF
ncbi:MAG: methylated-DNA--[protein]-cysteine S-methyltransferase [Spirochaetales bacterium]|nr:methylated-DNA--[protein]-cysteine S-methyltransferase [Spirochaetales bacterium]